ncbi:MAG: calcium/sodium antiporter [Bacteroidota bacterium]|nr:MAG: calcium/sodium antiporter [Bacteroidota bacterium]
MVLQFILLSIGFAVLIKGADWLVNGSVSIARHYKVSELIIGLTIVAFGTSSPELVVNIISSIKGYSDITMGNIVGSNIFNLMFILGISGLVFPLIVNIKTIWNEIPFSLLAAVMILILANIAFYPNEIKMIDRIEAAILLISFAFFMFYIFRDIKKNKVTYDSDVKKIKPSIAGLLILIGLAFLVVGSKLVVDSAVKIAQYLGASEKLIGVTIISAGTSLPELVTSVVAAIRKKSDIAIGNVIGSNIFNIFFILGISALIRPIRYNPSFNFDILLLSVATIVLFLFMFSGKRHKLDRWESGILLLGYIGYITYLLA